MSTDTTTGLQLRSLIKNGGELEISLATVPTPEPGPDEVVVRVEGAPINPSDLGLLIGPADMSTGPISSPRSDRSEEHTSELQSHLNLECRLLLEKKKIIII